LWTLVETTFGFSKTPPCQQRHTAALLPALAVVQASKQGTCELSWLSPMAWLLLLLLTATTTELEMLAPLACTPKLIRASAWAEHG
jgi:hypothetical protein